MSDATERSGALPVAASTRDRDEATADRRAERAAARRARARRGQAIAAVSTVVVLGGLAVLILTSPGWPEVRDTFFNAEVFADSFPDILEAFWLDVRVFCIVEVVVLILGLVVALMRTIEVAGAVSRCGCSRSSTRTSSAASRRSCWSTWSASAFRRWSAWTARAALAADRAGGPRRDRAGALLRRLRSRGLPRRAATRSTAASATAALAIGLTERQAMRHVILPQAVRRVGPPLLNDFIALQKDVALIAIIGVTGEAFRDGADPGVDRLQLHAAGRRRAALPRDHDPAGAAARPLGHAEGAAR